jgi:hypothetical protein
MTTSKRAKRPEGNFIDREHHCIFSRSGFIHCTSGSGSAAAKASCAIANFSYVKRATAAAAVASPSFTASGFSCNGWGQGTLLGDFHPPTRRQTTTRKIPNNHNIAPSLLARAASKKLAHNDTLIIGP